MDFLFDYKLLGYLCIGMAFSIIRCYFYAKKERNNANKNIYSHTLEMDKLKVLKDAKNKTLSELKGNVFRWWFMWPASLIYWIFSDIVSDIYNLIYSKVSKIYEKNSRKSFSII